MGHSEIPPRDVLKRLALWRQRSVRQPNRLTQPLTGLCGVIAGDTEPEPKQVILATRSAVSFIRVYLAW